MATMAFTFLAGVAGEGLIILVHGADPPTDLEWALYVREFLKHNPRGLRNLVYTDGGAPSGAQRKQVNDFLKGQPSPAVVVTGSYMVRGVVNALKLDFNPAGARLRAGGGCRRHALSRRPRRGHGAESPPRSRCSSRSCVTAVSGATSPERVSAKNSRVFAA